MKVDSKKIKKGAAAVGLMLVQELLQKLGSWAISKCSEALTQKKNSIENSGTEIASQNSQDSDKTKV